MYCKYKRWGFEESKRRWNIEGINKNGKDETAEKCKFEIKKWQ